ncbi:MAG: hypothetical protein M3O36_19935 [Myxococcota bacterium]|nr:hypothetical protein [Myxococcota bacterium]
MIFEIRWRCRDCVEIVLQVDDALEPMIPAWNRVVEEAHAHGRTCPNGPDSLVLPVVAAASGECDCVACKRSAS